MPVERIGAALVGHSTVVRRPLRASASRRSSTRSCPTRDRAIGHVNVVTGRGRHTSSSTVSLRDSATAARWIIDTPGVRSFGLGHVDPANILRSFTDLAAIAEDCPRGCTHLPDAPDCAIVEALAEGRLGQRGAARLDSLQRLLQTFADKTSQRAGSTVSVYCGTVTAVLQTPKRLEPGSLAPAFTLLDQDERPVALRDLRGWPRHPVLLPGGDDPGMHERGVRLPRQPRSAPGRGLSPSSASRATNPRSSPHSASATRYLRPAERPRPRVHAKYGVWGDKMIYGKCHRRHPLDVRDRREGHIQYALYNVRATGHVAGCAATSGSTR